MKLYSYAPTTGDHTYELDSGLHMTYTLEQAIALGYPIAEQFKGQKFSGVIDPDELAALRKDADSLMAMCSLLEKCRREKESLTAELAAAKAESLQAMKSGDGMVRVSVEQITDEMLDDLDEVADWLFDQISGHTEYIGRDAGLGLRGRVVQLVVKRLRSVKDLTLGNKATGG